MTFRWMILTMVKRLLNKAIQIAGSCSKDGNPEIIEYAHSLVRNLTKMLLSEGVNLVTTVDKFAVANKKNKCGPAIIFYWDVLEEIYEYAKAYSFSKDTKNIAKVISTSKSLKQITTEIPPDKQKIWDALCSNNIITVYTVPFGWNSGAIRRQIQEPFSDALVIIGGGEGVEHLSYLYSSHGKTILPLDIPVGSSCRDGRGGASYLFQSFFSHPEKFIPNINEKTRTKSTMFLYDKWKNKPEEYAKELTDFLTEVVIPQVFFVRLLNEECGEYPAVENFFKNIVTPFVLDKGYGIKDMGKSKIKEGFLNVEIFKEINKSSIIIADMTGLRLNCFMEMGYAFGLNRKVILTAKKGTVCPFDPNQIPCFHWNTSSSDKELSEKLAVFWEQNIDRGSLVTLSEII